MNLEDLLDPKHGLQEDEWSLMAPTFGSEGQLEVIGWSGKRRANKYYILKCNKCSEDEELFGEGYFKRVKQDITDGKVPCGCSKSTKWSREQYSVLCTRKAEQLGYKFLGFVGEWKGAFTKIKLLCEKHGGWDSAIISTLIHKDVGCKSCANILTSDFNTKPDEVMIESFLVGGGFHPNTVFWRSLKKDIRGHNVFWHYLCHDCGGKGEGSSSMLQKGCKSCLCSPQRPREAYINKILDGEKIVAIKFGITRNSRRRTKQQNRKSIYEIIQHQVYIFPDVESCRKAEVDCKQLVGCGILSKEEMPDGYTETTWVYNLDKIVEIYERNGGVKVD